MKHINEIFIASLFKNAMLEYGIEPPDNIIADGILHRFKIDGKPNGAYKLHLDGKPAGFFQDYKQGIKQNWKMPNDDEPRIEYTPDERRAYAIKREAESRKREAEESAKHQNAAHEAARIWAEAAPAITHPYLAKKNIQPYGARLYGQALLLPLYDAQLRLMSLQYINTDGSKRYLKNGQKRGCYWWIGKPTDKILICEGYATAASLFESTGYQCFIAWDAGNLTNVAEIIRAKKPNAEIVLCADNDESGVGLREAEAAALAVNGSVTMPPIVGYDFNDLANAHEAEVTHE